MPYRFKAYFVLLCVVWRRVNIQIPMMRHGTAFSRVQKIGHEWPHVGFESAHVDRDYRGANLSPYLYISFDEMAI